MSTADPRRKNVRRVASGFGAVALVAATAGSPIAFAATIEDAITSLGVVETSAAAGEEVTVAVTWAVPDGSQEGDTFTLTLPTMLVTDALDGVVRELRAPDGTVVATYTVSGQTVTFTLSEFASTHVGVHGTANFGVRLSRSLEPDPSTPVVFRVNGEVWPETDEIDVEDPGPGADYSGSATKWQAWHKDGDDVRGAILWAITGPTVPESLTGGDTYVLKDLVGPGQEIRCDEIHVFQGDGNVGNELLNRTYVGADRYTKECSGDTATVTIRPRASDVGKVFRMIGASTVTDRTLEKYTNSGVVTLWGTAQIPVSSTLSVNAGGDGDGTTPPSPTPTDDPTTTAPATPTDVPTTSVPTTTAPATPTDVPTTTPPATAAPTTAVPTAPGTPAPTTPVPTAPGTPAPTAMPPTATVTVLPGTPAPTATGTGTTPPLSSGTPVASGTATVTVTRTGAGAPVANGTPVESASPARIDTGRPADEANSALLAAGGVLTAGSLGALAFAARDAVRRRRD